MYITWLMSNITTSSFLGNFLMSQSFAESGISRETPFSSYSIFPGGEDSSLEPLDEDPLSGDLWNYKINEYNCRVFILRTSSHTLARNSLLAQCRLAHEYRCEELFRIWLNLCKKSPLDLIMKSIVEIVKPLWKIYFTWLQILNPSGKELGRLIGILSNGKFAFITNTNVSIDIKELGEMEK